MLADLNVDPPESDGEDHPPTPNPAIAAVSAAAPAVTVDPSTRYQYEITLRSDSTVLLLLVRSWPLQIVRNRASSPRGLMVVSCKS